jgi:hypothetical protein
MKILKLKIIMNYIKKMKRRVFRLTESQFEKIVKNVLNEKYEGGIIQKGDDICEIICRRKIAAKGSSGDVIKMIQHLLAVHNYNAKYGGGGMTDFCATDWRRCDGIFKGHTEDAVKEFQRSLRDKYGLSVDGIVGYNTWNAMCTTLSYTKSLTKNNFCKKCDCKEEQRWDDDDRWEERDEYDPIEIIDTIDCKLIKDCVLKHIIVPAPNYIEFERCIGWGKGDKKMGDFSCEECRKYFKPGYINLMPMVDPTEEQMRIFKLGRWCVEHCDGIYKAAV